MSEDPYPYREIGRRLKALRGDLSQGEFARRIGVIQQQYGRYEKGRGKPPLDILERIATQTNASIDWMLTGQASRAAEVLAATDAERLHGVVGEPTELYPGNAWRGEEERIKSSVAAMDTLNLLMADMGLTVRESHRPALLEYLSVARTDRLGLYDLLRLLILVGVVIHKGGEKQGETGPRGERHPRADR